MALNFRNDLSEEAIQLGVRDVARALTGGDERAMAHILSLTKKVLEDVDLRAEDVNAPALERAIYGLPKEAPDDELVFARAQVGERAEILLREQGLLVLA